MGCAAEAEKAISVGISVEVEGFDLADAGRNQAVDHIGFEIEMRLARGSRVKEALVLGISVQEARAEILVDLIAWLGNARADGGVDILPARAEHLHRFDGRIGDAGEGAAPAGVSGANDHATMVRE